MPKKTPQISVVMGVKDDEEFVGQSIESILSQSNVDFEFIIVNDGSSDNTSRIVAQYQYADDRIRIVEQSHKGLTCALIQGCKRANGKYIARQDAGGDISLPGRLHAQYLMLERNEDAVMVGSGTRFVGPEGEYLYDSVVSQEQLNRGLESLDSKTVKGPPSHCSAMMRRSAYDEVGGYRQVFYVAQDLDLWLRLYEIGRTIADETIRYESRIRPKDISSLYRNNQMETTKMILEAARRRRMGGDDLEVLNWVGGQKYGKSDSGRFKPFYENKKEAKGLYYIGACINSRDSHRARHYFRRALKKYPLHLRSWVRYLSTFLR